jgi:hypothetical protein
LPRPGFPDPLLPPPVRLALLFIIVIDIVIIILPVSSFHLFVTI